MREASGLIVQDFGSRDLGLGVYKYRVQGLGFRVQGLGSRLKGFGFGLGQTPHRTSYLVPHVTCPLRLR